MPRTLEEKGPPCPRCPAARLAHVIFGVGEEGGPAGLELNLSSLELMMATMTMSAACAGAAAGVRRGTRAEARAPTHTRLAMQRVARGTSRRASRTLCRADAGSGVPGEDKVTSFESEEEFDRICSEAGDKLVVLDVSTKTCGPCKMIFPYVCEMAGKYDNAVFLKIQGDATMDTRALMKKWGIRSVPTFRFFKNGELIHSHTGAKKDVLQEKFDEFYTA